MEYYKNTKKCNLKSRLHECCLFALLFSSVYIDRCSVHLRLLRNFVDKVQCKYGKEKTEN